MDITSQTASRVSGLAIGVLLLASCSGAEPRKTSFDEPFGFTEIRSLAAPLATVSAANKIENIELLRRHARRVSSLYSEALVRFDGTYGDGVGPARGSPEFLACKATFHHVANQMEQLPQSPAEGDFGRIWSTLRHCRQIANEWSGPAEMATFGNDFAEMTVGSMIAFSYAASTSNVENGQKFYREATSSATENATS